jgi:hypothetical protein
MERNPEGRERGPGLGSVRGMLATNELAWGPRTRPSGRPHRSEVPNTAGSHYYSRKSRSRSRHSPAEVPRDRGYDRSQRCTAPYARYSCGSSQERCG